MTEIETLREAARQMREKAEAVASDERWAVVVDPFGVYKYSHLKGTGHLVADSVAPEAIHPTDAEHIAGMDPAVALWVALLLEESASAWLPTLYDGMRPVQEAALGIARTYLRLGEEV